jgi:hypothetical protein
MVTFCQVLFCLTISLDWKKNMELTGKNLKLKTTKMDSRIGSTTYLALVTRQFLSCTAKYVVVNTEPYFARKVHEGMAELN